MKARIMRSTINATTILIYKVNKIWKKQQLAKALLMNVKRAFDHVSQVKLAQKIADLGINKDFIG